MIFFLDIKMTLISNISIDNMSKIPLYLYYATSGAYEETQNLLKFKAYTNIYNKIFFVPSLFFKAILCKPIKPNEV